MSHGSVGFAPTKGPNPRVNIRVEGEICVDTIQVLWEASAQYVVFEAGLLKLSTTGRCQLACSRKSEATVADICELALFAFHVEFVDYRVPTCRLSTTSSISPIVVLIQRVPCCLCHVARRAKMWHSTCSISPKVIKRPFFGFTGFSL